MTKKNNNNKKTKAKKVQPLLAGVHRITQEVLFYSIAGQRGTYTITHRGCVNNADISPGVEYLSHEAQAVLMQLNDLSSNFTFDVLLGKTTIPFPAVSHSTELTRPTAVQRAAFARAFNVDGSGLVEVHYRDQEDDEDHDHHGHSHNHSHKNTHKPALITLSVSRATARLLVQSAATDSLGDLMLEAGLSAGGKQEGKKGKKGHVEDQIDEAEQVTIAPRLVQLALAGGLSINSHVHVNHNALATTLRARGEYVDIFGALRPTRCEWTGASEDEEPEHDNELKGGVIMVPLVEERDKTAELLGGEAAVIAAAQLKQQQQKDKAAEKAQRKAEAKALADQTKEKESVTVSKTPAAPVPSPPAPASTVTSQQKATTIKQQTQTTSPPQKPAAKKAAPEKTRPTTPPTPTATKPQQLQRGGSRTAAAAPQTTANNTRRKENVSAKGGRKTTDENTRPGSRQSTPPSHTPPTAEEEVEAEVGGTEMAEASPIAAWSHVPGVDALVEYLEQRFAQRMEAAVSECERRMGARIASLEQNISLLLIHQRACFDVPEDAVSLARSVDSGVRSTSAPAVIKAS